MTTRRRLDVNLIPASAVFPGSGLIASAQPIRLEESLKLVIALGYKHDAGKVDANKQVTFTQGHACSNYQRFAGYAGDSWAPCAVVDGTQGSGKGWCIAGVKKP